MKKSKLIFPVIIYSVLTILLIIGNFFDLQINNAICKLKPGEYLSTNFALILSEIFGETIVYGLISFCALAIYITEGNAFTTNIYAKKFIKIFSIIVQFGINVFCAYKVVGYTAEHYNFTDKLVGALPIICYVLSGLAFSLIWYLIVSFFSKDLLIELSKWALIVLLTVIISQIFIQTGKIIFKRVRFRTMNYFDDFSLYSKWFVINRINIDKLESINSLLSIDAYKSFPSGHTGCASAMITLIAIPDFCIKLQTNKTKIILSIISVSYTFLIGFSRIIIGAHFLSDVIVAIIITYSSFYLSRYLISSRFNKLLINNTKNAEVE